MDPNSPISLHDIKNLPPQEAIPLLDSYLENHPRDDEAYTLRGLRHWSLNHRQEAINDYLTAIRLNPDSKAKMALEYVNSILDYYNTDLLNP